MSSERNTMSFSVLKEFNCNGVPLKIAKQESKTNENFAVKVDALKKRPLAFEKDEEVSLSGKDFKSLLPWTSKSNVTDRYMKSIYDLIVDYVHESNDRKTKIIDFQTPEQLMKIMDFNVKDEGENLDTMVKISEQILRYSVKTGHPRFFNQLFAGMDISCLMGQMLTAVTNTIMPTYEIAPVFLLMEKFVLDKMCEVVGFQNGDGILNPGGSISNMQAMNLARFNALPNLKEDGLFGTAPLVAFVSQEGHYSTAKAAATLGIGMKNVRTVATDSRSKMIPADLERQIVEAAAKGERPFFVCCTCGTTVAGAFDPVNEIADICERYGIWMHIDSALGGSSMFSRKHKRLMKGMHRADSLTWNPHKLLGCLLQCSLLLTKKKGILTQCNQMCASYLFQQDKALYDVEWDTGDKTFQCGRNVDILKLWMMWKAKGSLGFEEQIDKAFSNAQYLASRVKETPGFELLLEPEMTNICFYYVPPRINALQDPKEKREQLNTVAPEIKKRMTLAGTLMVGYQPLKDHVNFFRMTVNSPAAEKSDMDFVIDEIRRLGKDL